MASSLTTDSDRKLRHLLRKGIRNGALDWTMSANEITASSKWLCDAVGCGRIDLYDVVLIANEEFRRDHDRMRIGRPCRYVIVGGGEERVHGWWIGEVGTPTHEIMDVACRKLERIDADKFRAFHGRDPGTRRTDDFDVYRLPPLPWSRETFGMARIRGFPVACLPRLMAA